MSKAQQLWEAALAEKFARYGRKGLAWDELSEGTREVLRRVAGQ